MKNKPKCKEMVYRSHMFSPSRCSRNAVKDDYCRQHHPDEVAKRWEVSDVKWKKAYNRQRLSIHGPTFYAALKRISEGHNDPRGLATETPINFHTGDKK